MGWLVIFDFQNVMDLFPDQAFYFLALGGFFYTAGTIFYRWERIYFHHVIWHFFVLAGAAAHLMPTTTCIKWCELFNKRQG